MRFELAIEVFKSLSLFDEIRVCLMSYRKCLCLHGFECGLCTSPKVV